MIDFELYDGWTELPSKWKESIRDYSVSFPQPFPAVVLPGAASALSLMDRGLFKILLRASIDTGHSPREIYEGVLQCYLSLGYPRAIEGMKILRSVFKSAGIEVGYAAGIAHDNYEQYGDELFRKVHGDKHILILDTIESASPEIREWIVKEAYGKVLSREGLDWRKRELINLSSMLSERVPDQVISHIKGSINVGVSISNIEMLFRFLEIWNEKTHTDFARKALERFK
ncbi:MAG: hypothetical protein GF307_04960 [candidate division Zixibacteria bacterium]|nr:hypothetical protein [candidate division Zixibacteria bacterium]